MADKPSKYAAPAELPRFPTIIRDVEDLADNDHPDNRHYATAAASLPSVTGTTSSTTTTTSSFTAAQSPAGLHDGLLPGRLAPPPKFPSLVDVALPNAKRASAAATTTTSDARLPPSLLQQQHQTDPQIAAAIARSAVEPGTGERRAREAGEREWTPKDEEILKELLLEDHAAAAARNIRSNNNNDSSWIGAQKTHILAPPLHPQESPIHVFGHDDDDDDHDLADDDEDDFDEEDDHLEEGDVLESGGIVSAVHEPTIPTHKLDDSNVLAEKSSRAIPAVVPLDESTSSPAPAYRTTSKGEDASIATSATTMKDTSLITISQPRSLAKSADAPSHAVQTEKDLATGDASWIGGNVKLVKSSSTPFSDVKTDSPASAPAKTDEGNVPEWVKTRALITPAESTTSAATKPVIVDNADDEVPDWIKNRPSLLTKASISRDDNAAAPLEFQGHTKVEDTEPTSKLSAQTEDAQSLRLRPTSSMDHAGLAGAEETVHHTGLDGAVEADDHISSHVIVGATAAAGTGVMLSKMGSAPTVVSEETEADLEGNLNTGTHSTVEDLHKTPKELVSIPSSNPADSVTRSLDVPVTSSTLKNATEQKPKASPFITVPVRSGAHLVHPEHPLHDYDGDAIPPDSDVGMQTSESAADDRSVHGGTMVNVTRDFGLVGGHDVGVNDAAFLDVDTLVTAGADGKVCFWDIEKRSVKSEFSPHDGESVAMLHILPEEEKTTFATIMTLSSSRQMRIWFVTPECAVVLRSMQIPVSKNDLVMSIPKISPELKVKAAAAAASVSQSRVSSMDPEMDTLADEKVVEVPAATGSASLFTMTPGSDHAPAAVPDHRKIPVPA